MKANEEHNPGDNQGHYSLDYPENRRRIKITKVDWRPLKGKQSNKMYVR